MPVQLRPRVNRFSAGKRSKIHQLVLMKMRISGAEGWGQIAVPKCAEQPHAGQGRAPQEPSAAPSP